MHKITYKSFEYLEQAIGDSKWWQKATLTSKTSDTLSCYRRTQKVSVFSVREILAEKVSL